MMYKFIELPDKTEITHSDMRDDGTVKVCVEKPVEGDFKTAYCELPSYRWYDVEGYTKEELEEQQRIVESLAHLINEDIVSRWTKHFEEIRYFC